MIPTKDGESHLLISELHVDHQSLEPDQNLVFDPRTCAGLSKRLLVLNASKNKMVDLAPLNELHALETLNISENYLSDLQSAIEILSLMKSLKSFDLRGNPLTKLLRYREHVIVRLYGITYFTGMIGKVFILSSKWSCIPFLKQVFAYVEEQMKWENPL